VRHHCGPGVGPAKKSSPASLSDCRDVVYGVFTPELAKQPKSFSLINCIAVGVVGIPVKVNGDSSGKPNGVPPKANSRRSEATLAS
jgi:hypothetical protein